MATKAKGIEEELSNMEEGAPSTTSKTNDKLFFGIPNSAVFTLQKFIAEVVGTYLLVFSGCAVIVVNKMNGSVTFPGICVTWGLIVMVMIYSVGHISGAHFNPAVTIALAIFRRFPPKEVPIYVVAQLLGALLASVTLVIMFDITHETYFGNVPAGSNGQALAVEIIVTASLMFVISGINTDDRAVRELNGVAVGMTLMLNVFVAGPVSGASMNPARSIAPAIVKSIYKGLWIYIVGPIIGAIVGAFVYNLLRVTDKPVAESHKAIPDQE